VGNKKNVDTKPTNIINKGNNDFLNPTKIEIGKSSSVFSNNDKLQSAQKILDNQKERMTQNKGFGLTSSIGFLNINSSIGKNQLLGQTIKIENLGSANNSTPNNPNEMINSNKITSQHKSSIFSNNRYNKKNEDDIEEIVDSSLYSNVAYKEIKSENKGVVDENEVKVSPENKEQSSVQTNIIETNHEDKLTQNAIEIKQESSLVSTKKNGPDENNPKTVLYNAIHSKDVIQAKDMRIFLTS
jgi:hypothetical protein